MEDFARSLADESAGMRIAARMAMIAITTSSSIRVKHVFGEFFIVKLLVWWTDCSDIWCKYVTHLFFLQAFLNSQNQEFCKKNTVLAQKCHYMALWCKEDGAKKRQESAVD